MEDFFSVLKPGGTVEIRVPDSEWIIASDKSVEWKLRQMYGGQDTQQGTMDFSRIEYPQFFCHKYGWTRERIRKDLEEIGFTELRFEQVNANFVTYGKRP
jgi:predicted SAM-dependent methyltransferase